MFYFNILKIVASVHVTYTPELSMPGYQELFLIYSTYNFKRKCNLINVRYWLYLRNKQPMRCDSMHESDDKFGDRDYRMIFSTVRLFNIYITRSKIVLFRIKQARM